MGFTLVVGAFWNDVGRMAGGAAMSANQQSLDPLYKATVKTALGSSASLNKELYDDIYDDLESPDQEKDF